MMPVNNEYTPKHHLQDYLKPGTLGSAEITHFTISHIMEAAHRDNIPPGDYVRLRINGEIIMSDTPMEYSTNAEFIQNCYGDVFVAGLGLGMVLLEIMDKRDVRSVTVLEKSLDVINLVKPQLPLNSKVKVLAGDIFSYRMLRKYDYIYFDIWPAIEPASYLMEMPVLKMRYRNFLKSSTRKYERILCWGQREGEQSMKEIRSTAGQVLTQNEAADNDTK